MPINVGTSGKIAFYPAAGDTIDDTTQLYYNNSTNEFTSAGRNTFVRNTYEVRSNALLNIAQYHSTSPFAMPITFTRGRGSSTAQAVVQNGDQIGRMVFAGSLGSGTTTKVGAYIAASVDGTVTTSNIPMKVTVGLLDDDGVTFTNRLEIRKDRIVVTRPVVTTVGDVGPNFDLTGNGSVDSGDAIAYLRMNGEGSPSSVNNLNSRAWIKGSWDSSSIGYGGLFAVEGNAIDALRAAVELPAAGFGDTLLLGNITTGTGFFSSGLWINGASVGIRAKDTQDSDNPIEIKITSSTDGTGSFIVTGNLKATGEVTAYFSDERLKKDITPITGALDKVMAISGYTYKSNDRAEELGVGRIDNQIGLLAQEVEAVMPELVTSSAIEGYKTVRYDKLVSVLVNAVKEQQQMIDELKNIIKTKLA